MTGAFLTAQVWITVLVGCAAIADDVFRGRIANAIPVSAFVSGLALQSLDKGWHGAANAFLGLGAGTAAFVGFYILGGMGGGDIKLIAGLGAVLGPSQILVAALWAAACGGIIAALALGVCSIRNTWKANHNPDLGGRVQALTSVNTIPYAPAIALGVWLSLASRASGI